MFKYLLQFLICLFVFAFSTIAAWYEGSAIIERSLEWAYSTPFTQAFGIEIVTGKEIIVLDYFYYAIKFQPFFPLLMLLCLQYTIGLLLVFIGKTNISLSAKGAFVLGIMDLVASNFFFNASTFGGKLFFFTLLISSLVKILVSVGVCIVNRKQTELVNMK